MSDEPVDVIDQQGRSTGKITTRNHAHQNGIWHRSVHVWVYTADGRVLLQQRSHNSFVYLKKWDVSASGHVQAGDTPEQTAVREVFEELGIDVQQKDLVSIGAILCEMDVPEKNWHNKELQSVFLLRYDGLPEHIVHCKHELAATEFIALEKLEQELLDPEIKKRFVPWPKEYIEFVFNHLRNAIEQEKTIKKKR